MPSDQFPSPTRRADAERNRDKILAAARSAFADPDAEVSMAEISRRAGVGMATLYRNFPGRRELLEALYTEEVNALCGAAETVDGETPGAVLMAWLHRFFAFSPPSATSPPSCSRTSTAPTPYWEKAAPGCSPPAGRSSWPHSAPTKSAMTSRSNRSST